MSDLISRQALREGIEKLYRCDWQTLKDVVNYAHVIDDLPSAEPERKTGEWIDTGWKIIYKCSNCGNFLDFNGLNAGRGDANFCPNCGADMRGENGKA